MFVAVPPGRDENPVRVFATFTEDLERLSIARERSRDSCCKQASPTENFPGQLVKSGFFANNRKARPREATPSNKLTATDKIALECDIS
jgi:hypothetical protein